MSNPIDVREQIFRQLLELADQTADDIMECVKKGVFTQVEGDVLLQYQTKIKEAYMNKDVDTIKTLLSEMNRLLGEKLGLNKLPKEEHSDLLYRVSPTSPPPYFPIEPASPEPDFPQPTDPYEPDDLRLKKEGESYQKIPCVDCGGSGEIKWGPIDKQQWNKKPCEKCKGTGKVPKFNYEEKLSVIIETIPSEKQRYRTVGDWIPGTPTQIKVSDLSDERYEFLVALHELIEYELCKTRGISDEVVVAHDKAFIEKNGYTSKEPGDDPNAPYRKEHQFATEIEKKVAEEMGIKWEEYEAHLNKIIKKEALAPVVADCPFCKDIKYLMDNFYEGGVLPPEIEATYKKHLETEHGMKPDESKGWLCPYIEKCGNLDLKDYYKFSEHMSAWHEWTEEHITEYLLDVTKYGTDEPIKAEEP